MECEAELRRPCEASAVAEVAGVATDYDQERSLVDSPPRPRMQSRRQRRRVLSNPLLDTISAIEDDDSDELGLPDRKGVDGDSYTAGYVGGSSIDSGYKSSCPTPEMVDIAYYTTTLSSAEQQKRLSVASQTSQDSAASVPGGLGVAQKPRIAMGTKVMTRQTTSASSVEQPRRRHDSGFSDATLNRLAVVRENLLKMERTSQLAGGREAAAGDPHREPHARAAPPVRPRSASMGSMTANSPRPNRRSGSPGLPPRAAPPAAAPAAGRPASPPLPPVYPRRRSPSPGASRPPARTDVTASRRPRPPPARPAPRDAPRAPARPAERNSRRTREEDIDVLMYGRRPAATSTGLLAPSRRADAVPRVAAVPRAGPAHEFPSHGVDPPTTRPTTGRPVHGIRSKFSHMAQCMLDIIDELHSKGRVARPVDSPSPSPSDYHTYEEVMYGVIGRERVAEAAPSPEPPPLPLRPSALFGSARDVSTGAPAECPRRPDAPKQRNNLYSLFSSARDRRSLSHSLEQEFSGSGPEGDEYGFAVRK